MNWYIWAFIIVAAAVVAMVAAGTKMFYSFTVLGDRYRKKTNQVAWDDVSDFPEDVVMSPSLAPFCDKITAARGTLSSMEHRDCEGRSDDGLRLSARFIPAKDQRGIVLMMHGFHSSPVRDLAPAALEFLDLGMSCFMPYHRAHGESEGKYITYGIKERRDVVAWCRFIEKEFPGVPVVLQGVSMGAASVMMACGEALPASVCGVIADSGYTSPDAVIKWVAKNKNHLSLFPFYYTTSASIRLFAKFSLGSASTTEALSKNKLPLLLIHGTADTVVPYSMSEENLAAASSCDAKLVPFDGAEHCVSVLTDREKYRYEVSSFLDKCINR